MITLPFETVLTEAQTIPRDIIDPLRPHICGGHAELRRYSEPSEKALCLLGTYGPDLDATYAWPNKTAGTLVDLSYVKVYIDDAHLKYYTEATGSGDTIAPVAGYKNRIKLTPADTTRGYKANGASYPRLTTLLDRDVRVGDVVRVRGGGKDLWSTVQSLIANVVAASIGAATADSTNVADQAASKTPTQTAGALNYVTLTSGNVVVTAYDGLPSGDVNETYTVTVIQASTGGDATTARLAVVSASGRDNQASVTPSAFAAATAIGTRGATMQWTVDNTRPVDPGQPTSDFVVGQTWRVVLGQAFTAAVGTSAGTYTGTPSASYKLEVIRGGKFQVNLTLPAPNPNPTPTTATTGGTVAANTYYVKVTYSGSVSGETNQPNAASSVTTTGATSTITIPSPTSVTGAANFKIYVGTSSSGPFYLQGTTNALASPVTLTSLTLSGTQLPTSNSALYLGNNPSPPQLSVTAAGVDSGVTNIIAANTAYAVGTLGVTFKVQSGLTGIRKGDIFYIEVTGPADGAYQTIVLGNNMEAAMVAATDLTVDLFIKKNIQVAHDRVESSPNVNWSSAQTGLTLKSGITAYDETWTTGGSQQPLAVTKGTAYVEYRSWLTDFTAKVSEITATDPTTVGTTFGPLHPDNPLGWGVWRAVQLSNGYAVKFTAVADPDDVDEWSAVLTMLQDLEGVYDLAPMTFSTEVQDLYAAHVAAQSVDEKGMWRRCILALQATATQVLVNSTTTVETDGTLQGYQAMATLADDPATTGTQYTLLNCTTLNSKFVTLGVKAGDIVRLLYTVDGFGHESYTEFLVGSVVNEDSLLLQSGHTVAISTAQRFEVWRAMPKDDIADALVARAQALASERVICVWPDSIEGGGLSQSGYFVAAALAGYMGGAAPHQGLAYTELYGFDGVTRTTSFFNNTQLQKLKDGGIFTISQAPDGTVFVLYARNTLVDTLDHREEMVVRAADACRFLLRARILQYRGYGNLTESLISRIRADLNSGLEYLKNSTFSERIGKLLESGSVIDLRVHSTELDRLVVVLAITGPKPLNDATVVLVI